jgi:hypothetical protein
MTQIFDLRFKLFVTSVGVYLGNFISMDVLDMANKAGTMPMQVLMLCCIVILGGVIVWQNRKREELNQERHKESQKQMEDARALQQELIQRINVQQASIDAERVARIGKLMEQQAQSIDAQNNLANAQSRIADALNHNNRTIEDLGKTVGRFIDHLPQQQK